MRDIRVILSRWGAWARTGQSDCLGYPEISPGFEHLIPKIVPKIEPCSEDDGILIDAAISRLKRDGGPGFKEWLMILILFHLYRQSLSQIATIMDISKSAANLKLQLAEGFVLGVICAVDVRLDCEY